MNDNARVIVIISIDDDHMNKRYFDGIEYADEVELADDVHAEVIDALRGDYE